MTGSYKKYSSYLIIFFLIFIGMVVTFNFTVDALGVFHDMRVDGFNKKKTEVVDSVRQFKVLSMDKYKPEAVIIGSSRTDRSLHPDYLEKNNYPLRYYNLSILGTNPREMRRYFEHAYNVHKIKEAVIGLDFEMFNANTDPYGKDIFNKGLLSTKNDGSKNIFYNLKTQFVFLCSAGAVEKSFLTIKKQKRETQFFKKNGAMDSVIYKKEFVENGGANGLLKELVGRYYKKVWSGSGKPFVLTNDSGRSAALEIEKIVGFAIKNNIKVHFFITPVHSYFEEARDSVGLYDLNREWKRLLASIIFSSNKRAGDGDMFRLWDFSGYNFVTEEEFPPAGDSSTELKYFGDAVHFTKDAGELILARIFNFENSDLKDGFGILLSEENMEAHLETIDMKRKPFIENHPEELENLSKWVGELVKDAVSVGKTSRVQQ